MDSVSSDSSEVFDSECLKQEDCQYILRALEKRAFEYIVCALRAQGPLSQYKEVILDHLKSLLFISDDDFLLRIRLSANDPILTKIAQELNPSYDNVSEWLAAGYSLVSLDFSKVIQMNSSIDKKNSVLAVAMQKEMAKHNACLDEERAALLKLLQLSKKPYVSEKLRRLLHDTEKDINGRSDIIKEKTIGKTRHVGRPRRAESAGPASNNTADLDAIKNKNSNNLTTNKNHQNSIKLNLNNSVQRTSPINVSVLNSINNNNNNNNNLLIPNDSKCLITKQNEPVLHGIAGTINASSENGICNSQQPVYQTKIKNEEIENHKLHDEFSIHYSGGANVVIVDPEDQNTIKEPKIRKRRSKIIDDISCTCARILPFIFERAVGDMPKPPRGNPDKRCSKLKAAAKRASQLGYSGNNDLINSTFNYVPKQIELASNSYYSKNLGYINSNATCSIDHFPTPSKRIRGDDENEVGCIAQNVIYQRTQPHTSRTIKNSNLFSSQSVQRQQQQHIYYNNPVINSSENRNYNLLPNGNSGDTEVLNSNVEFRNSSSHIVTSKNFQPTIIMTSGSTGRILPQDVQLVEDSVITSDSYGSDVYLKWQPLQLSSHQQNTINSTIKEESPISNTELYIEGGNNSQYTVGNLVIQTVSNNDEQLKNSFQDIASTEIQKYEQPIITQKSVSPPKSVNYCFASSGLDFLASTASLLTPINKQSGVQTNIDNNNQIQNLNTTKTSNSVQTLTASTIIPSNVSYELQTALQGNQHILTSHLYIVSSQKKEDQLTTTLHLQNSSTPKIFEEASVPTKTFIVDYNTPSSLS